MRRPRLIWVNPRVTRPDPRAGKVPGLGCGCAACRQPLPAPEMVDGWLAANLQRKYEAERAAHREITGQPNPGRRGRRR